MRTNVVKRSTGSALLLVNALAVENVLQHYCGLLPRIVENVEIDAFDGAERSDDFHIALGNGVVHGCVLVVVVFVFVVLTTFFVFITRDFADVSDFSACASPAGFLNLCATQDLASRRLMRTLALFVLLMIAKEYPLPARPTAALRTLQTSLS